MIGQGRAEGEIGWRRTEWVGGSNYVKISCQSLVRGTCAAARGFEFRGWAFAAEDISGI